MTTHRIPGETVHLGMVLELVTEDGDTQTVWDEAEGWHVLTTANAFDMGPGYAKLFLVPGTLGEFIPVDEHRGGADTYQRWHARDPDTVQMLDVPESAGTKVGRAVRLDYSSDKWNGRGKTIEYTHSFMGEGMRPPLAYVRNAGNPKAFVLVGGDMTITEDGIA